MNELLQKLSPEVWTQVLKLYDVLCDLPHDTQVKQLKGLELSEEALLVLQKMLVSESDSNILNTSIDPLVESLLGKNASHHINPSDIVGRKFGPWQVIKPLASGGMGQVFIAHRADGEYEKDVALKIIKSGQFSELSKQKFIEEMRTLARFEHPNIARLIDGGTNDDDILYFVMELVTGSPICQYAIDHKLSLNERINLVLQTIDAVGYAHQNLVIHGDIKPANILVNEAGQVKLVDFGVARPLHVSAADINLPQFTPSYSSPEQVKGDLLSTASDVFGLCAVLYELCTGSAPRESATITTVGGYQQQLNIPIEKVYQRLKAVDLNEKDLSLMDGLDSKALDKALSHELGTIIDKGLQVDISARYKNTTELSHDLQLFLQGSAVPNHATHFWYRLSKTWQKNKLPITISTAAVFGVVASAVFAFNQAAIAEQEAEKANWSNQFLLSIFDQADPVKNQQKPMTVNQLAQVASEQLLNDEINLDPPIFINALSLLGTIQSKLGEAEAASNLHIKQIETIKGHGNDLSELAQAHFDLAMDYQQLGKFEPAMKHFKQASSVIPVEDEITHVGVTAMQSMAMIHTRFGKLDAASDILGRLLLIKSSILKADKPNLSMTNIFIAQARLETAKGNYELALKAIENSKYYFEKIHYDPIFFAEILGAEASIYGYMKRFDLAGSVDQKMVAIFKDHYGVKHPETMIALANQATHMGQGGDYAGAINAYLEIVNMLEDLAVPDFFAPIMYQNLAHQYRKAKQCEHAMDYFNQAEGLFKSLESRRIMGELNTANGLARCYLQLNELADSALYFEKAINLAIEQFGNEHKIYAQNQLMRVALLLAQNKYKDADLILSEVLKIFINEHGISSVQVADVYLKWAELYELQGLLKEARQKANQAVEIYVDQNNETVHAQQIAKAKGILGNGQ